MSSVLEFSQLRQELDDAITYFHFEEAEHLIDKGLQLATLEEDLNQYFYFKGQLCVIKDAYKNAFENFIQAIKYDPNDTGALNDIALCYCEWQEFDEALQWLDTAIRIDPEFATLYHNRGWILNQLQRNAEAITFFNIALEKDPQRAVTYASRADSYWKTGALEKAEEDYRKALSLLSEKDSFIREQLTKCLNRLLKGTT